MSTQATSRYYKIINDSLNSVRGGWNSAELILYSVNFANIEFFVRHNQWDNAARYFVSKAIQIEQGGADFVMMATNTMHRIAPEIQAAIQIPLIHIVDVAAEEISKNGITKVGVLGTNPVMQAGFYRNRFEQQGI